MSESIKTNAIYIPKVNSITTLSIPLSTNSGRLIIRIYLKSKNKKDVNLL